MPLDLKLDTTAGPAYVDSAEIDLVSAPFRKPGQPPVFCVGLKSGSKVYPLENQANIQAVRESKAVAQRALIPAPKPDAPKRGRGRPKKEPAATASSLAQAAADMGEVAESVTARKR